MTDRRCDLTFPSVKTVQNRRYQFAPDRGVNHELFINKLLIYFLIILE